MDRLTEIVYGNAQIKECGNDFCKETCEKFDEGKSCNNCPIQKAIDKLTEYEDLDEQGKLLKLPCAVGDRVWYWTELDPLEEAPFEGEVRKYEIAFANTISMIIVPVSSFGMSWGIRADEILDIEDFGKTVFLTKSEAEEALKKMNEREGENG